MQRGPMALPWRAGIALAGLALAAALLNSNSAQTQEAASPPAAAPPRPAEPAPKLSPSRITHVTVYVNSALVTREVEVPAGVGNVELIVSPLPQRTVINSLYSEGSEGVRVLTTRYRVRPVQEDTREEVRKLDQELKKLRLAQAKLQADLKTAEANLGLLGKLENFTTASTVHATEKGKIDSDSAIALTKYVMDGRGERTHEQVAIQQQLEANNEQTQFITRKLHELTAGASRSEQDAVIVVEKTLPAVGKVRLNYLVDNAAWRPQYKLRAGKVARDPLQLEYLAAIVQQTGEDWSDVQLVLSTAQPMLNASPPDLKKLAVAVVPRSAVAGKPGVPNPPGGGQTGQMGQLAYGLQGAQGGGNGVAFANTAIPNPMGLANADELNEAARVLRHQAQAEVNGKKDAGANDIFNYAGALEQARDLALLDDIRKTAGNPAPIRHPSNEGPSVTYHLAAKMSVPSRQDEQVLEVARIDMAPDYFYKAVPVLTPHVYRQATLVNKSKYVLLPGEATMYDGSDFVGRMNLPLVAVGEQFTVGFGAEPQLQVHRQMIEKTRAMQGGNQILKYEYRILASSFKGERVRLQVWDRLPSAENETMGVSLVKATPELSKDGLYLREERPSNLLRWDLDMDADMNGAKAQAVQYEFKLELDRQMTFGSFQSK